MRGEAERQIGMLTLVTPEQRVRGDHPLRHIKPLADAVLKDLSPTFAKMYSSIGRPSIPPERLLKASLLMGFYTVRSERLFCEQLDYNLLFRWFLDMGLDEPSFDHSSFSRNRTRLLKHDVAPEFRLSPEPVQEIEESLIVLRPVKTLFGMDAHVIFQPGRKRHCARIILHSPQAAG